MNVKRIGLNVTLRLQNVLTHVDLPNVNASKALKTLDLKLAAQVRAWRFNHSLMFTRREGAGATSIYS